MTWNEISTSSAYGLPHPSAPLCCLISWEMFHPIKAMAVLKFGCLGRCFCWPPEPTLGVRQRASRESLPLSNGLICSEAGICSSITVCWGRTDAVWDSRTEMYNIDTYEIGATLEMNVNINVSCCIRDPNEETRIIAFLMHEGSKREDFVFK